MNEISTLIVVRVEMTKAHGAEASSHYDHHRGIRKRCYPSYGILVHTYEHHQSFALPLKRSAWVMNRDRM